MAAIRRRIILSCRQVCSPPLMPGHKIRAISAQIEFLEGTGAGEGAAGRPSSLRLAVDDEGFVQEPESAVAAEHFTGGFQIVAVGQHLG